MNFFAGLVVGLLGAGHCIAMCGGISSMLTAALPNDQGISTKKFFYTLYYNIGRIISYSLIGFIAGFTGSLAAKNLGVPLNIMRFISGIFLILLGLYIGRWYSGLVQVEKVGQILWKFLSPLNKKFLPVDSLAKAFGLGALWGWLPCGLVYSTLTWSVASADPWQGALIMMGFGIGTLPALLSVSVGFLSFRQLISHTLFRQVMAITLIIYGIITLKIASGIMF